MTDKTTVIHHRIPDGLAVFIDDMAQTMKYHNKAHLTAVAIQLLKDLHDGKITVSKVESH